MHFAFLGFYADRKQLTARIPKEAELHICSHGFYIFGQRLEFLDQTSRVQLRAGNQGEQAADESSAIVGHLARFQRCLES